MRMYWNEILLPVLFFITAIIVGIVLELIVYRKIKEAAIKRNNYLFQIFIYSLRGLFLFTFTIAGAYAAINTIKLLPETQVLVDQILIIALVLGFSWWIGRLLAGFVNLYTKHAEGVLSSTSLFANITRIIVFLIGLLVIIQFLGVPITPMLTAFGLGGLAVALALEDTLSNMFSGINILSSGEIEIGDYIKLESGEEGYVKDITWRNTTIKPLSNNIILVPNSKMASSIITNYHQEHKELLVMVPLGVAYDSDLEKVEKITIEVANEVMLELDSAEPEFEPYIRFFQFDDSSINFNVFLSAKEFIEQYRLKHVFIKRLHQRYKQEGIVIPFPIRTLYMKK